MLQVHDCQDQLDPHHHLDQDWVGHHWVYQGCHPGGHPGDCYLEDLGHSLGDQDLEDLGEDQGGPLLAEEPAGAGPVAVEVACQLVTVGSCSAPASKKFQFGNEC
jgi:hypothetical protein